ncbi:MAG: Peptidoglycan glycosyltransferase [candidate division WWE3 bacterium GW2011_GWC1_47_10]|uniref:Peptidoglycan glycosyltransferase n=1 Tax=candidate division WWE3 bacterium GW2011_GWC1_47_10 TaxID=1619122 RepID=A0A0G1R152_UNCKA|nr:MAG: Peptidoglycan glycosyltransferase [candidate division WWE3 bacterium GW2011_GWC1_47_10]
MQKTHKQSSGAHARINFFIACTLFVMGIFLFKLFTIQVLQHEKYAAMAQSQYWSLQQIPAKRGQILTKDGFALASNSIAFLLFAQPKLINDSAQTANDLAAILMKKDQADGDFAALEKELHEKLLLDLSWVALVHGVTEEERKEIEQKNIAGLGFDEEPIRYYPEKTLAAHVLGFVGKDDDGNERGYFGIEGGYDGDLRGRPGRILEERDAAGAPILVGGYRRVNSIDGRDIELTIDRPVQYIIEKYLKAGVLAYGAVSGSVIVMNPVTGDVLAMANYPTYDPGKYTEVSADTKEASSAVIEKRNLSISETYEPGSVMKALTIASAVDAGKVTPATTFTDAGPVVYSDYTIDNWDGKHYGMQNIVQLLQKSNNIGAAWVGHLLGANTLSKYFKNFGLGAVTNVGLEGEDTGTIRNYEDWTDIDLATISFGQGISATPLQMLNAVNVIANGGFLMQPRIVARVHDNGDVIDIPEKELRRVLSKETADTMVDLLTKAVEGGESKFFNIRNYRIAGKTGTAQIPVEGKYDPTKTNATFVGFLAASKKFSMIVRLDRPSASPYASETAVPLWMQITKELAGYYGIPPDIAVSN